MTWRYRQEDFDHGIITEVEKGHYERRVAVRPGDAVIDGGANIGWFTKQIVDRAEKVFCFEANPHNFEVLKENIEPYKHVEANHRALWSSYCSMPFYVHHKHPGAGGLYDFGVSRTKEVVEVATCTIDGCLFDGIDFIKLDVEKAELEVLRGAQGTLTRCRPVIAMEAHPPAVDGAAEIETRDACMAWWGELLGLLPPDYIAVDYPEPKDAWQGRIATFVPAEREGEIK